MSVYVCLDEEWCEIIVCVYGEWRWGSFGEWGVEVEVGCWC